MKRNSSDRVARMRQYRAVSPSAKTEAALSRPHGKGDAQPSQNAPLDGVVPTRDIEAVVSIELRRKPIMDKGPVHAAPFVVWQRQGAATSLKAQD
jgi:hypothetical protein